MSPRWCDTGPIPGFDYQRVAVDGDVTLNVAVGGSGSPIVLLHGFPQTHLMWRHVATDLAADHAVICPDLRGYGASDKPAERDADTYSKRTMAADIVTLASNLGHRRFTLAGHDRGALVAWAQNPQAIPRTYARSTSSLARSGPGHRRAAGLGSGARLRRRSAMAHLEPESGTPHHVSGATSWPKRHPPRSSRHCAPFSPGERARLRPGVET